MGNQKNKALTLKMYGHTQVKYEEDLKRSLYDLMRSWRNFCAQGIEHKQEFVMTLAGGYESKNKIGQTFDQKENFHVSMAYEPSHNNLTEIDTEFIFNSKLTIQAMFKLTLEIAEIFGYGSDFDLKKLFSEAQENHTLRLLHYPAGNDEKIIAQPHVDKGITIHLLEDAPGLELLWRGVWRAVHPAPGHLLTYSGMLGQYYSQCEFPALCHRVVSTPKTFAYGRNSIVMFIDFGDVVYDKETFGRTQDVFPNGENYNLNFNAFKKYFTSMDKVAL